MIPGAGPTMESSSTARFCGKSQHEVRKLIAGPSVFVCDECVELCNDIIREELEDRADKARDKLPQAARDQEGAR